MLVSQGKVTVEVNVIGFHFNSLQVIFDSLWIFLLPEESISLSIVVHPCS